jgi:glyoxylase-like metal-dependent hydrolase (beta-lactamase superfamily II)
MLTQLNSIERLSEQLYRFENTCNVYVIRSGDEAVLIDFGDGSVLRELSALGITRVTDVLITHHHRDQAQGLVRAVEAGIRIWVPHTEQDLFRDVDAHWQARLIYNNYDVRQDRFSLLEPVPIAGALRDYATYSFGAHAFTVIPTPGHTLGSISLLAEIDGQRIDFTGDLIAAPGKVWSLSATQWTYNGAEGVAASIPSLLDLKERQPGILLPSHGEPITEPGPAIDLLVERLWQLLRARGENPRLFQLRERPYELITSHLLKHRASMANTYVLLSESQKALLVDFGYDFITGVSAGADRTSRRPWLYTLPMLKRDFRVEKVDVVVPTHYHDDHVAGLNLLRDVEGAQVWAAETFADILEQPSRYDLPCLWYDPIPVDRRLPLGQPIQWEEYTLTLHELPGHTLYAVAIEFEVDGKRVLATGDQYQGEDGLAWNYVYQNRFRISDYQLSAGLYRQLNPDLILSGHWEPLWVQPQYFEQLIERGELLDRLHRELLPLDSVDFGAEGVGARIQPYQVTARGGEVIKFEVEIRNPFDRAAEAVVQMVVPVGWQVAEDNVRVRLDAHTVQPVQFHVTPPVGLNVRRARVAVDLTIDGRRFGQQAEALVTVTS